MVKKTSTTSGLSPKLITLFADEVAKTVARSLPSILKRSKKKSRTNLNKKIENSIFLDTSAIIDGRIFEVINLSLFRDIFVVSESVLLELKHLADSQDTVKRERGRRGLELLEKLKKSKKAKLTITDQDPKRENPRLKEVDEKLINMAKTYRGRIITCDYNLEKKASIQGVPVINVNALANCLKVTAVPGEALHLKIQHQGKDPTQGVGYLDDGTMIVIEGASLDIGKTLDVVVARVIQTTAGRILFAKKI